MENMPFQTEVKQLLHMMIHSVYTNKEIFLRELTANAADAVDKARFLSLTKPELAKEWEIRIAADPEAKTLSISDNGIGMSEQEARENLGTIAKSGTKAFLENLEQQKTAGSPELIGQFGVGFYSVFMVADKVSVDTLKAGEKEPVLWESAGEDTFTIGKGTRTEQGTTVTLHLKSDCEEFLQEWKISSVISKYSDYIEHPIRMMVTHKDKDGKDVSEDRTLNSMKAIWLRTPSEVKDEEYKSFYSHLSGHYDDPIRRINYSAEGASEYKALLFIPSMRPFDFTMPGMNRHTSLHLYIRRVFITDSCENLLPDYLRFVSGVVDSADLPLNISRETLQDNPQIRKIGESLTKRVLTELVKMQESDRGKYDTFYSQFGQQIKEGAASDYANREKIQSLLMYETLNNPEGKLITLKEYATSMPSGQKEIYYMSGESRAYMENSPHMERFRKAGYDVILMHDPIDEWVIPQLGEFDGKKFVSVSRAKLEDVSEAGKELDEKAKKASEEKDGKDLLSAMKKALGDKVKDVVFSGAMTESAARLSAGDMDPSPYMERILKAMKQAGPDVKRTLELNPAHPLIAVFEKFVAKSPDSEKVGEFASMLYDQALLAEGSPISDPARFAKRTAELMTLGIEKEI